MKKFTLLLVLFLFVGFSFAQEEPIYDADTVLYITTEEGVRVVTTEEMWGDFDNYEAQSKIDNNAHTSQENMGIEDGETAEEHFVVPMLNTEASELQKQAQEFTANTADYVPSEGDSRGDDMQSGYNKSWGIPSIFEAYIDAIVMITGGTEDRTFHAHFIAGGKVFSKDMKALELNADMANNSSSPTASASCKVFGQTIWQSNEIKLYINKSWSKEKSWTWRFMIGPIPVSVTATVGGTLGFSARLQLSDEGYGITGLLLPNVNLYGKASAQVDIVIAKAGVEGEIVFLDNHLYISASVLFIPTNTVKFLLQITNNLVALKGKITIFAAIRKPWGGWKKFSKVLFEWAGITKNWTIFDASKTITVGK
jgi:hypothetical protein